MESFTEATCSIIRPMSWKHQSVEELSHLASLRTVTKMKIGSKQQRGRKEDGRSDEEKRRREPEIQSPTGSYGQVVNTTYQANEEPCPSVSLTLIIIYLMPQVMWAYPSSWNIHVFKVCLQTQQSQHPSSLSTSFLISVKKNHYK